MKKYLFIAVTLVLAVSSCMSREIRTQDLLGKYRADLPDGAVEFLDLLPQGECAQEIRLKGGVSYSARGKWRYDQKLKCLYLEGTRIALTPAGQINPDLGRILEGNTGALSVSRSALGKVTIMLNEGIDYRKL
jgi:hypothetical protein